LPPLISTLKTTFRLTELGEVSQLRVVIKVSIIAKSIVEAVSKRVIKPPSVIFGAVTWMIPESSPEPPVICTVLDDQTPLTKLIFEILRISLPSELPSIKS